MTDDSKKKIRLERFGDTADTWRETYKPGESDGKPPYIPIKPNEQPNSEQDTIREDRTWEREDL